MHDAAGNPRCASALMAYLLLEKGLAVDALDAAGCTPLHSLCMSHEPRAALPAVRLLLSRGASASVSGAALDRQRTPLELARHMHALFQRDRHVSPGTQAAMRGIVAALESGPTVPEPPGVAEVRRLTNLGAFSVDEMLAFFSAKPDDVISRDKFKECLDYAIGDRSHLKGAADEAKLRTVMTQLYDVFDTNDDGNMLFSEMGSGLSVLCGGEADDKAAAQFKLFNANGDAVISRTRCGAAWRRCSKSCMSWSRGRARAWAA